MTEDLLERIASSLLGTCNSIEMLLESMDIEDYDVEEIEDAILDFQVERCSGCGWWFECHELESEKENGKCKDCR
jgi:hypothetical protein